MGGVSPLLGLEPVLFTERVHRLTVYTLFEGTSLTHDQLLQRIWGQEYSGEVQLVRVFIGNLRRKLGDDASKPRYIFTEPRVGYRMAKP